MRTINFKLAPLAIAFVMVLASCQKRNQDDDVELDTRFSANETLAETTFNEIDLIADQAEVYQTVTKKTEGTNDIYGDPIVTLENGDTNKITVDFGTESVGQDGKKRKGKIIIRFKGTYYSGAYFREIKTEDYYIDGIKIICERKVVFVDEVNSQRVYEIKMNAEMVFSDGNKITRESDRKRTILDKGVSAIDRRDDDIEIKGTIKGLLIDGRTFEITTNTPLVKKGACDHISEGIIKLSPEGKEDRIIDYGDGSCDNKAKVIVGSRTWNVTL